MKRTICLLGMIILTILSYSAMAEIEQTGYTTSVPAAYREASDQSGTVEELIYDSLDYVRAGRSADSENRLRLSAIRL